MANPTRLQSTSTISRFVTRLCLLAALTILSRRMSAEVFAQVLELAAIFAVICALALKERPFVRGLTHWDEAAGFFVLARATSWLGQAATA